MRAMILAAGRGERMGELTTHTPKPLLKLNHRYLIEYNLMNLKAAGIHDILINVYYLADKIIAAIGDGKRYGLNITYLKELEKLETGGGVINALPYFQNEPFIVVSADIVTDFPLHNLSLSKNALAHLVMVNNPHYHPQGDFGIENGYIHPSTTPSYTFANIGIYHPDLFKPFQLGYLRLADILKPAIHQQLVTGEHYRGQWHNVGTPTDLAQVIA